MISGVEMSLSPTMVTVISLDT